MSTAPTRVRLGMPTVRPVHGEGEILLTDTRTAEMAKLVENSFRDVNIAFANELSVICAEQGIDVWELIELANHHPRVNILQPGPGVGGHCIPIDPNYLSYEVRKELGYPFRFVELAQEINNSMPTYVVDRAVRLLNDEKKALNGSKVLLLGITYKPNIADQRQSPAVPVAQRLLSLGADLHYHDPFVETWNVSDDPNDDEIKLGRVNDLNSAVEEADIVILLQPHADYDIEDLVNRADIFFDTVGITEGDQANRL